MIIPVFCCTCLKGLQELNETMQVSSPYKLMLNLCHSKLELLFGLLIPLSSVSDAYVYLIYLPIC